MSFLVIVRHGLSQANVDHVIAGHLDTDLTETGHTQAKETARLIKDIPFHEVHGSSLKRAKHTLETILNELQLNLKPKISKQLKERGWGELDGQKIPRFTENPDPKINEIIHNCLIWEIRPPGGESYEDVSARVIEYFSQYILPKLKEGKNILLVGHNGMLKTLQRHLEELPYEQTHSLDLQNAQAKVYEFDMTGKVLSVNYRGNNT